LTNINDWLSIVGINNPPVPKTDTQETEDLDKTISLDQEGASMCSLPLSKHRSTKWMTVLFLISLMQLCLPLTWDLSLMQLYLPLTWDLSWSKVHNLSRLAKRPGGWVRAYSWWVMELYRNPEEARIL
jgi:hypothetical protein